jgi:hypothetical protein
MANRIHDLGAFAEVADDLAGALEEPATSDGELNTSAVTVEQGRAEAVFEIADAAADRGFLDADGSRRLAEAAMLGSSDEVTEMAELDGIDVLRHLPLHAVTDLDAVNGLVGTARRPDNIAPPRSIIGAAHRQKAPFPHSLKRPRNNGECFSAFMC